MEIAIGALICILIILFFICSSIYLRLDKFKIRIEILWKQMEDSFEQWVGQTEFVAAASQETFEAGLLLEEVKVYRTTNSINKKLRSLDRMRELYESSDIIFRKGDSQEGRRQLCEALNYDLFYLNDAMIKLNHFLMHRPVQIIGKTVKIQAFVPLKDFT